MSSILIGEGSSRKILDAATSTGAGPSVRPVGKDRTFQVTQTGGTSGSVDIEVSNDDTNWLVSATVAVTNDTAGTATDAVWEHTRANITAIVGGSITVLMAT